MNNNHKRANAAESPASRMSSELDGRNKPGRARGRFRREVRRDTFRRKARRPIKNVSFRSGPRPVEQTIRMLTVHHLGLHTLGHMPVTGLSFPFATYTLFRSVL